MLALVKTNLSLWQYPPKHYEPPDGNRPSRRVLSLDFAHVSYGAAMQAMIGGSLLSNAILCTPAIGGKRFRQYVLVPICMSPNAVNLSPALSNGAAGRWLGFGLPFAAFAGLPLF